MRGAERDLEEDFLGFSYGFRPKRSQHDALDALITGIHCTKVNYIFDADLRSFFNSVSQQWLIRFLKHRINDTRMLRLIQKWLKAGVLEDGVLTVSDRGTGQGSVISPLLANVYLHYVFDLCTCQVLRPRRAVHRTFPAFPCPGLLGARQRTCRTR